MTLLLETQMSDEIVNPDLELARQLFDEYYAQCLWHWKPDLVITAAMIPAIVRGLCTYGGRKGMLAAAKLQRTEQAQRRMPISAFQPVPNVRGRRLRAMILVFPLFFWIFMPMLG